MSMFLDGQKITIKIDGVRHHLFLHSQSELEEPAQTTFEMPGEAIPETMKEDE